MITFIKDHFDTIITITLTAVGFIITYLKTKNDFKNELVKFKLTMNAEVIKTLPYDICQLMNSISSNPSEKQQVEKLSAILSNVISYGSIDAVNIASKMQEITYANGAGVNKKQVWLQLAAYSLLITQIKYDITSVVMSPESWFRIKVTDFSTARKEIQKAINELVEELHLNKEFEV